MKYSILSKNNTESNSLKNRLIESLDKDIFLYDDETPDVCIVIGGDGTFLKAVHKYIDIIDKVAFVGIKTGALGYFFEFTPDRFDTLVTSFNNKQPYFVNEYSLLEAKLHYEDEDITLYGINEIRLENPFKTLVSDVYINGEFLETFRGNGLLVSGTLGSTGYNKSCHGAVIDSSLNLLQLSEINGINNSVYNSLQNSIILDPSSHIKLKGAFKNEIIGYDNKINEKRGKLIEIEIFLSAKKVKILRFEKFNFISKLKASFIKE